MINMERLLFVLNKDDICSINGHRLIMDGQGTDDDGELFVYIKCIYCDTKAKVLVNSNHFKTAMEQVNKERDVN